jgi:hypothetical protein
MKKSNKKRGFYFERKERIKKTQRGSIKNKHENTI